MRPPRGGTTAAFRALARCQARPARVTTLDRTMIPKQLHSCCSIRAYLRKVRDRVVGGSNPPDQSIRQATYLDGGGARCEIEIAHEVRGDSYGFRSDQQQDWLDNRGRGHHRVHHFPRQAARLTALPRGQTVPFGSPSNSATRSAESSRRRRLQRPRRNATKRPRLAPGERGLTCAYITPRL
jgi:hypothetical protein